MIPIASNQAEGESKMIKAAVTMEKSSQIKEILNLR